MYKRRLAQIDWDAYVRWMLMTLALFPATPEKAAWLWTRKPASQFTK